MLALGSHLSTNGSARVHPGMDAAETGSGDNQPPWRDGDRDNARVNEGPDPRAILIPGPGLCHGGLRSRERSVVLACGPSQLPHAAIQYEDNPDGPGLSEYVDAIESDG